MIKITPHFSARWTALAGAIALILGLTPARCQATTQDIRPVLPRLKVHPEGHYLETSTGQPFFWLADTAWTLLQNTTRDEASYYLRTRAAQGYNVIQIALLDDTSLIDNDPRKPNQVYFDRMAEVADEAGSLGLYVVFMTTWGDKLTAPWGPGPRLFRLDNLEVSRAYGHYLGDRLKDRTNVIWMLGGDRPPRLNPLKPRADARAAGFADDYDWRPIWRAMAEGLAEGSGHTTLCLYHPSGSSFTSIDLHQEPWLDINGMQSGHGAGLDAAVWEWVANDFALKPAKPTLDLEPNYEDHPVNPWPQWDAALGYFRDHDVRKQCYRSVLAGACGVTYGHHAVWSFSGGKNPAPNHADRDWISALYRPAGEQMKFLRQLIESRPFFSRIPDESLVRNPSPGRAEHITASRDRDGSYAFVYFPNRDQTATVDLSKLSGRQLRGWWFDPRTGFPHPIEVIDSGAPREFTSPPYGPDWVLVLDDAASDYPLPGLPLPQPNSHQ